RGSTACRGTARAFRETPCARPRSESAPRTCRLLAVGTRYRKNGLARMRQPVRLMPSRSRSPDAHRDGLVSRAPRRRGPRAGIAGLVEGRARVARAVRAVEPAIALDVLAGGLLAAERRHSHGVEHPLLALRQGAAELGQLLHERLALGLARHLH